MKIRLRNYSAFRKQPVHYHRNAARRNSMLHMPVKESNRTPDRRALLHGQIDSLMYEQSLFPQRVADIRQSIEEIKALI